MVRVDNKNNIKRSVSKNLRKSKKNILTMKDSINDNKSISIESSTNKTMLDESCSLNDRFNEIINSNIVKVSENFFSKSKNSNKDDKGSKNELIDSENGTSGYKSDDNVVKSGNSHSSNKEENLITVDNNDKNSKTYKEKKNNGSKSKSSTLISKLSNRSSYDFSGININKKEIELINSNILNNIERMSEEDTKDEISDNKNKIEENESNNTNDTGDVCHIDFNPSSDISASVDMKSTVSTESKTKTVEDSNPIESSKSDNKEIIKRVDKHKTIEKKDTSKLKEKQPKDNIEQDSQKNVHFNDVSSLSSITIDNLNMINITTDNNDNTTEKTNKFNKNTVRSQFLILESYLKLLYTDKSVQKDESGLKNKIKEKLKSPSDAPFFNTIKKLLLLTDNQFNKLVIDVVREVNNRVCNNIKDNFKSLDTSKNDNTKNITNDKNEYQIKFYEKMKELLHNKNIKLQKSSKSDFENANMPDINKSENTDKNISTLSQLAQKNFRRLCLNVYIVIKIRYNEKILIKKTGGNITLIEDIDKDNKNIERNIQNLREETKKIKKNVHKNRKIDKKMRTNIEKIRELKNTDLENGQIKFSPDIKKKEYRKIFKNFFRYLENTFSDHRIKDNNKKDIIKKHKEFFNLFLTEIDKQQSIETINITDTTLNLNNKINQKIEDVLESKTPNADKELKSIVKHILDIKTFTVKEKFYQNVLAFFYISYTKNLEHLTNAYNNNKMKECDKNLINEYNINKFLMKKALMNFIIILNKNNRNALFREQKHQNTSKNNSINIENLIQIISKIIRINKINDKEISIIKRNFSILDKLVCSKIFANINNIKSNNSYINNNTHFNKQIYPSNSFDSTDTSNFSSGFLNSSSNSLSSDSENLLNKEWNKLKKEFLDEVNNKNRYDKKIIGIVYQIGVKINLGVNYIYY